jgi:hypothetical protein
MALAMLLLASWSFRVEANDAAVESAAGGLQLRSEGRVAIIKERLSITKKVISPDSGGTSNSQNEYRVIVEYEFLNESKADVATEVAFPLPEFGYPWEDLIQDRRVKGFKLEVDGKELPYATEVRAVAGGHDVTDLLNGYGIEIETFGRFDHTLSDAKQNPYQVLQLSGEKRTSLKAAGAIGDDRGHDSVPLWTVAATHHWKQVFPAGKILKVRHEYNAIPGFSYDPELREYLSGLEDGCFDAGLIRSLEAAQKRAPKDEAGQVLIFGDWVKYILTTAKTWKMPIRDFELIVERPPGQFVSFCWDGKVEKLSETRFRATARDFMPTRELMVYFFTVENSR